MTSQLDESLDFSDPLKDTLSGRYLRIDTTAGNLWQTGITSKPGFLPGRGLMTDTLNAYPPNNRSVFEFSMIHCPEGTPGYHGMVVSLNLDIDTDSLQDGFTIEARNSTQVDWHTLGSGPLEQVWQGPVMDTIAALGLPGFSGKFKGEIMCSTDSYSWESDTVHWRVVFGSDSVQENKSGIKINSILVIFFFGSVEPVLASDVFTLQSNPVTDQLRVTFSDAARPWQTGRFSVVNMQGQEVLQAAAVLPATVLDTEALPAGLYLLRYTGNGVTTTARFVK